MLSNRIFRDLNKTLVIQKIDDEMDFSFQYFTLLFLSVIIATLGLIINNSVIVIGAMLLSPVIWPILGLSLSTVISRRKFMSRALLLLVLSIILTIITAAVISYILPFRETGSEIINRINPTLFDLIIAVAAGFAACLVVIWPKYAEGAAGVAIAAAILPPICVTGIGIAFWDYRIASGSFLLFLTNLASIVFASIIIFTLARFYKREGEEPIKKISIGLLLSFIVLIALGIQFFVSFREIIVKSEFEAQTRTTLTKEFEAISGDIKIDNIVIASSSLDADTIGIEADVKTPEDIVITISQKQDMIQHLRDTLHKDINLSLRITKVLEAYTPDIEDEAQRQLKTKVQNTMINYFAEISNDITIQSLNLGDCQSESDSCAIETVLRVPDNINVTYNQREELVSALSEELMKYVDLKVSIINYTRIKKEPEKTDIAERQDQLETLIIDYISEQEAMTGIFLSDLHIEFMPKKLYYQTDVILQVPQDYAIEKSTYLDDLRTEIKKTFGTLSLVNLQVRYLRYEH